MQDLRLAIRALRSTPIVSIIAVLSLALGIGANTAIFSLVNSLLLRPLPVAEPQQLAVVSSGTAESQVYSYATWEEIRMRSAAFGGVCAWRNTRLDLAQSGEMRLIDGLFASGDFFATLGVRALLGRTFTVADDVRGGGPDGGVAVISYRFWQGFFGGAANVIGKPVTLERRSFTIIGVTPPDFFGAEVGRVFDVAVPITSESMIRGRAAYLDNRGASWLTVMVRAKTDQSLAEATGALRGLQPQIREAAMPRQYSATVQAAFLKDGLTLVPAAAGTSALRKQYERPLLTIFAIVALVLLIACANVANLLLARGTARGHELSVRRALGATPWRLARQGLVESLVLAAAGAAAGLVFAVWGSRAVVAQLAQQTSIWSSSVALDVSPDWRVLAFTTAVTVITALLFGMGPALLATRVAPIGALKEHGGGSTASRFGVSSGLVVAQVALSLVLVVAAGLFVRTFVRLAQRPLGFDSGRVLVMDVDVSRTHIAPADRLPFYLRLTRTVAEVPGVANAAGSLMTPVSGAYTNRVVDVPGTPPMPQEERLVVVNFITPGWFSVYGTPLRSGRDVDAKDAADAPPVAVVNDAFVRRFFPGRDPLGTLVAAPAPARRDVPKPKAIVGVVADAVYRSLREPTQPTMYLPLAQWDYVVPFGGGSVSVRSASGPPSSLAHGIATALTAFDSDLAFSVRPLTDQVDASLTQERVVAMLAGFFGALALLLAGLGLYGVTSYAVSRRRTELGIRMALGAAPSSVVRLVLRRVSILVGLGVLVGASVSVWASKFVATLLYGLEPRDPVTLTLSAAALATVGALAGLVPAHRASRIDPAEVLRDS